MSHLWLSPLQISLLGTLTGFELLIWVLAWTVILVIKKLLWWTLRAALAHEYKDRNLEGSLIPCQLNKIILVRGWEVMHWGRGNFSERQPWRKGHPLLQQPLIVSSPLGREGLPWAPPSIHDEMSKELISWKSCVDDHSYSKFVHTTAMMSGPRAVFLLHISASSGSYILSTSSVRWGDAH